MNKKANSNPVALEYQRPASVWGSSDRSRERGPNGMSRPGVALGFIPPVQHHAAVCIRAGARGGANCPAGT